MTDDPSPGPVAAAPTEPPELPDLLLRAARSLRHEWVRALEPHGLSPHQARALRAVTGAQPEDQPGGRPGLRVSDLASALRIAPRSATEVADGLEDRGLVVRAADPADRRAVVLRATEAGRATSRRVEHARAAGGERVLARLGGPDRAELARLLRLLLDDGGTGGEHRHGGSPR